MASRPVIFPAIFLKKYSSKLPENYRKLPDRYASCNVKNVIVSKREACGLLYGGPEGSHVQIKNVAAN